MIVGGHQGRPDDVVAGTTPGRSGRSADLCHPLSARAKGSLQSVARGPGTDVMLSCREVARMVASDELADAGWARRLSVRLHSFMCRHCTRYAAQLRAIGASASKALHQLEPPTATLHRLEQGILGPATGARRAATDGGSQAHGSPDEGEAEDS